MVNCSEKDIHERHDQTSADRCDQGRQDQLLEFAGVFADKAKRGKKRPTGALIGFVDDQQHGHNTQ